jgi:hypothetical protein
MSSTADVIRAGVQQAAAGKELDSNTIEATGGDTSHATSESETEVRSENSTVDDLLPASEDTPTDSPESAEPKAEAKPAETPKAAPKTSGDKEVITVTDETGRKRKVEIDYSDRERIKQAFSMASGARKWQADRDREVQARKAVEAERDDLRGNFSTLENAWKQKGIEGVVDLLAGRAGSYKDHVRQQVERAKFLENASPEEIRALEAKEQYELRSRELESIRKENEEFRKQIASEREAAELRSLEAKVHPVFDKYRFADKLGDADDEQMFDEMLWNTALKRLESHEEQGHEVSPELIEREFSTVARAVRKRMTAHAEKKATKAVEQKKQEATENVQSKVMSGYKTGGAAKEARDLLQSGNLTALLKGWGKYGSLFKNK